MSKVVVNATLPIIAEEIENILEVYPNYPYQQAFTVPDRRQELLAYVLNRVRNHYVVVNDDQVATSDIPVALLSLEERFQMEIVIRRGIADIFSQAHESVYYQILDTETTSFGPSNWFG